MDESPKHNVEKPDTKWHIQFDSIYRKSKQAELICGDGSWGVVTLEMLLTTRERERASGGLRNALYLDLYGGDMGPLVCEICQAVHLRTMLFIIRGIPRF